MGGDKSSILARWPFLDCLNKCSKIVKYSMVDYVCRVSFLVKFFEDKLCVVLVSSLSHDFLTSEELSLG